MGLVRWSPFEEMEVMRRQMDRMFDSMLGGPSVSRGFAGLPQLQGMQAFVPNIEVYTTEKEVVVKAELPGIDSKDLDIEVTAEVARLSGELKREEEVKEDNYYRTERSYGRFERVVPLPNRVKDAEAKASFKNGVLTIRAPLAEEVKKPQGRKLQIES